MGEKKMEFVIKTVIKGGEQYLVLQDGSLAKITPFNLRENVDDSSICGGVGNPILDEYYFRSPFKRIVEE